MNSARFLPPSAPCCSAPKAHAAGGRRGSRRSARDPRNGARHARKVRTLSQALHPVVLDDAGFEGAVDAYLPRYERQTGIAIRYEKTGRRELDRGIAIHLYRVLQEALNNVARHSNRNRRRAAVLPADSVCWKWRTKASVSAHATGMAWPGSMRERAELVNARWNSSSGKRWRAGAIDSANAA